MPFGMKNVTSTFFRIMIKVFGFYWNKFLKVFVDDLNVHNMTYEKHLEYLCYVILWLKEVNLKLNLGKCEFVKSSLTFLGHVVSHYGTQPDFKKIKVVTNFPIPTILTNVRMFLGLTRYYRNYIKGYFRVAIPLFDLTKKTLFSNGTLIVRIPLIFFKLF
jgi:hypothetical protein